MLEFPKNKYRIIYADPPWKYGDKVVNRGGGFNSLERHYDTMDSADIAALPIASICLDDCALFMWTTDSHIPDALKVIEDWGFEYKTVAFYWLKIGKTGQPASNLGKWTQKNIEACLFATRGRMAQYLVDRTVRQLISAHRQEHSRKRLGIISKECSGHAIE